MEASNLNSPLVYDHASDDHTTLGSGKIRGLISGTVDQEYAAVPTAQFQWAYTKRAADLLKADRILLFDAGNRYKRQMYRIEEVDINVTGSQKTIDVTARHIAGDILGNLQVSDVSRANSTPSELFSALLSSLAEPMDSLTFNSDIGTVSVVSWMIDDDNTIQDILFGQDATKDSFIKLFKGEWTFDNYQYNFNSNGGRDTGIVVKMGKNMLGMHQNTSISDVYTAVRPFAKFTPGTNGSGGDDQNIIKTDSIGLIQYAGNGGLPIYDSPWKGHHQLDNRLNNGRRFKVYACVENGGALDHTWYNLGGNQWVDGNYLSFDKGQTSVIQDHAVGNEAVGIGTIAYNLDNDESKRTTQTIPGGVGTVQFVGPGQVAIWDSPWRPHNVVEYVKNGYSYKVYKTAKDSGGGTWYNLGGNRWIDGQYFAFSKGRDYLYERKRGIGTVKADKDTGKVGIWNEPSTAGHVFRFVNPGSRWQIYGVADNNDKTWYDLGGGQWIQSDYMGFENAKDVDPNADKEKEERDDKVAGVVWIYDRPGDWNTKVKQVKSGERYKIFGLAQAGGETWYNLGGNQWIVSSAMTFNDVRDVEPKGTNTDMTQDVEPVTITLPEGIIRVPSPDGRAFEHQRIISFDASEYGVETEDELREVAQAYIRDKQIGKPKFSITFDYSELTGEYSNLTKVDLYDRVMVYFPDQGINMPAEVTAVTFDVTHQQNTQVTIGTRPEILTDELAKWRKKAEDDAQTAASESDKKIDDLNIAWQKAIDATNAEFEKGIRKNAADQTKWADEFTQQINQNINSFRDDIGAKVTEANKWQSIISYTGSQVTLMNGNSQVVGTFGAGGLEYHNPSTGQTTTVVSANGDIVATQISANALMGAYIKGAQIDGGKVTALDYFSANSNGGTTVISGDWGLSADSGINVARNGSFSHFGGAINMDGALTSQSSGYFQSGITLGAGGSSYIAFSNGCYLYSGPGDTIAIHDGNGSHKL
jgi:phage minor structural protein